MFLRAQQLKNDLLLLQFQNYVQCNVISDARIIAFDGQYVKTFKLERGEFLRSMFGSLQ